MSERKREKARKTALQERSQFTMDVILEAATLIFRRNNYLEATVYQIVEKAGVYDHAISYYYNNKETLFFRVVEKRIEHGTQRVIAVLAEKSEQLVEVADIVNLLLPIYVDLYRVDILIMKSALQTFPNVMAVVKLVTDSDSRVAAYLCSMLEHFDNPLIKQAVSAAVLVRAVHAAARCIATSAETEDDLRSFIYEALHVFGITGSRAERSIRRAKREGLKGHLLSIITCMGEQRRVTVSDLEVRLEIKRRTLQRYLRVLVNKGFVWEVGTSATDPMKFYELL